MSEKPYDIRQRSLEFAKDIIRFVSSSQFERIHFAIFDQLLRSGTSIGANVEEGRSGSLKKDFKRFYIIALKSANETKYWLNLIKDTDISKVDISEIDEMMKEADELSKIIASIIIKLDKEF
ncbi:MAG TPA: four helix bundle protein [Sphingobacteriaceae bacterium]